MGSGEVLFLVLIEIITKSKKKIFIKVLNISIILVYGKITKSTSSPALNLVKIHGE